MVNGVTMPLFAIFFAEVFEVNQGIKPWVLGGGVGEEDLYLKLNIIPIKLNTFRKYPEHVFSQLLKWSTKYVFSLPQRVAFQIVNLSTPYFSFVLFFFLSFFFFF